MYGRRWRTARKVWLAHNPYCVFCKKVGITRRATVIDHIIPHRFNTEKFWDKTNWQALCKLCHDGIKQATEKSGKQAGNTIDGRPVDANHPWNKRKK